ncbi:sulfite exporter TauE/SafE family protein [Pseudomonas sp. NY15364]|uniref:sulfite exporter TauE/SafE family protein n=1 Tax=Pseudomonas sp. NY15364 TaxID=3400353 RepID=UPI003A89D9EF
MLSALHAIDTVLLAYVFGVFVLGGVIKGVSGFGMPLVTVPLIALVAPVPTAVALSLLPIIISNISQGYDCRRHYHVLGLVWPLLISLAVSLGLAVQLLGSFRPEVLAIIIGVMIQVFVISQLTPNPPLIPPRWRFGALIGAGLSSGLLGGMTSFYGFPALQALLALGLGRTEFILASSLFFLVGSVILGAGLLMQDIASPMHLLLSLACVLPTQLGMSLGEFIRERLSQAMFRGITLAVLSATGLAMIVRALTA